MELCAGYRLDPGLNAEMLVPGNALKKRVDKTHNHGGRNQLRVKTRALGNAARNDGGDGGRKCQQKEKLDQLIAVFSGQLFSPDKKVRAISHAVTYGEIGNGGDGKIRQNFDQCIDLILFADGAQLQKGKTSMHGQHHDAPQ